MDEQSAPAPKPESTAPAPRAQAPSAAYTAPPPHARARRGGSLALIAALALGGVGLVLARRAAPPATDRPAVEIMGAPIVYRNDFDARTTAAAREILLSHPTAQELSVFLAQGSRTRSAALEESLRQLAAGPQELRDDVLAGRIAFYTVPFPSSGGGAGDVYDISVDGSRMLRVTAGPGLASVTIPLDASKLHSVATTLVLSAPPGAAPVAIAPLPAAMDGFSADAPAKKKRAHLFIDNEEVPVPRAPRADIVAKTPKAARCVVTLSDQSGANETTIGNFPCDCGAVHWTGNVGACSVTK